ncbi:hypothetical protein [uncultured Roseovarius sp.]|uniref:hypothetical protein n=1 Tax=uncultured Roseovarius sp. TaxID=293344 RepID=UPI00260F5377|nr:hypothetical protein [uncultured Roseovarius sp.]
MTFFLKSKFTTLAACFTVGLLVVMVAWWAGWLFPRQTLPGRLSEYHKVYDGFWDVACDTAMDGSDRRCYIQYVDVYRDRPDFAAAMVEVVYHPGDDGQPDPHVRFDIEPGYSFRETRMSVVTADGKVPFDTSDCRSNTCRRSGDAGRDMLKVWRAGSALELVIEEGRSEPAISTWPLDNINAILDDFEAQRQARNLP